MKSVYFVLHGVKLAAEVNVIWEMEIRGASRALADGGARRHGAVARAVVAALAIFDRLFVLEGKDPVKVNRRA